MDRLNKILCFFLCLIMIFSFSVFSSAALMGDADGSGAVEPEDARLVLRHAVGLEELTSEMIARCDMDQNGKIEPSDARVILRIAVGLPDDTKPSVPELSKDEMMKLFSDKVSYNELAENMDIFCNGIGSRWYTYGGMSKAESKIISILKYNGFEDKYIDTDGFYCNGVYAENVIAAIPTAVSYPDVILFCAHYDSASSGNGAVDNGSGLCAVLELSRVMKELNIDFGLEIRFAFFACEELGYYGAYRYINSYATATRYRHSYVINLDMAGYSTLNNYNYLTVSTGLSGDSHIGSNKASLMIDSAKQYIGWCGESNYYSGVSAGLHDLRPFRNYGLNAVTLSWRVIDPSNGNRGDYDLASSRYIHTVYDTMSNFSMNSLYNTTRLLAATAAGIYHSYLHA